MRWIEQSILYDILNIEYSMLLLFEIPAIEVRCLSCLLCSVRIIITSERGSLNME